MDIRLFLAKISGELFAGFAYLLYTTHYGVGVELTREQLRKLILESISKVTSKGIEIGERKPREGEYVLDLGSSYYGQMGALKTDRPGRRIGRRQTRNPRDFLDPKYKDKIETLFSDPLSKPDQVDQGRALAPYAQKKELVFPTSGEDTYEEPYYAGRDYDADAAREMMSHRDIYPKGPDGSPRISAKMGHHPDDELYGLRPEVVAEDFAKIKEKALYAIRSLSFRETQRPIGIDVKKVYPLEHGTRSHFEDMLAVHPHYEIQASVQAIDHRYGGIYDCIKDAQFFIYPNAVEYGMENARRPMPSKAALKQKYSSDKQPRYTSMIFFMASAPIKDSDGNKHRNGGQYLEMPFYFHYGESKEDIKERFHEEFASYVHQSLMAIV